MLRMTRRYVQTTITTSPSLSRTNRSGELRELWRVKSRALLCAEVQLIRVVPRLRARITEAENRGELKDQKFTEMDGNLTLNLANFSTLFVCMVLKFPQIFVLMRARTSAGVSLNSLLLELVG